jgi:hypothetical protein
MQLIVTPEPAYSNAATEKQDTRAEVSARVRAVRAVRVRALPLVSPTTPCLAATYAALCFDPTNPAPGFTSMSNQWPAAHPRVCRVCVVCVACVCVVRVVCVSCVADVYRERRRC